MGSSLASLALSPVHHRVDGALLRYLLRKSYCGQGSYEGQAGHFFCGGGLGHGDEVRGYLLEVIGEEGVAGFRRRSGGGRVGGVGVRGGVWGCRTRRGGGRSRSCGSR